MPVAPSFENDGKLRRIAFVADSAGWAFDNIAKNIGRLLEPEFEVVRFYAAQYSDKAELIYDAYVKEAFDIVHFIGREIFFQQIAKFSRVCQLAMARGCGPTELAESLAGAVTTASVYDHLHLDEAAVADRQDKFALLEGYSTSSRRLYGEYSNRYRQKPINVTQDGVNPELFKPHDIGRFARHDRPLVVGWAGNSLWPRIDGNHNRAHANDPKGLRSIIIPAIEKLQGEGLKIVGKFADRNVEWRPYESMPEYYGEIDVLVCASLHEGTPNPVLEAMACGVPVVSSNVGVVPEVLGPAQSRLIVQERTRDAFARAIKQLYEDRCHLQFLSRENLQSIQGWSWQSQLPKWRELFHAAGSSYAASRGRKILTLTSLAEASWKYGFLRSRFHRLKRRIGQGMRSKH